MENAMTLVQVLYQDKLYYFNAIFVSICKCDSVITNQYFLICDVLFLFLCFFPGYQFVMITELNQSIHKTISYA